MKSHFIIQCGGGKKITKKFSTEKTAATAAMKHVAKPKGPRICLVRPVKLACAGKAGTKCRKKIMMKLDPVRALVRTAHGVKSTRNISTRRG